MNEIIAALYTRLTAQLSFSVFDHVPQDSQDYPFVKINPIQTTNDDRISELGFSATVDIVGYSRYRGLKEINDVIDEVYAALHQWQMADTATYEVGNFIEQSRSVINAPDGLTRNSIQTYQFYFEPL